MHVSKKNTLTNLFTERQGQYRSRSYEGDIIVIIMFKRAVKRSDVECFNIIAIKERRKTNKVYTKQQKYYQKKLQ